MNGNDPANLDSETWKSGSSSELTWLSVHLFLSDPEGDLRRSADRLLLEVIRPFVQRCLQEELIEQFFFIRYSELGPHVRLRLRGEAHVLKARLQPALEHAFALQRTQTDADGPYATSTHPLLARARWIEYVPEIRRYGGTDAVHLAESLFHVSSEVSFHLLQRKDSNDPARRLALSLLAATVLLHAMSDGVSHAIELATAYRDLAVSICDSLSGSARLASPRRWSELFEAGYGVQSAGLKEQICDLWLALSAGQPPPAPLDYYHEQSSAIRIQLQQLARSGSVLFEGAQQHTSWEAVARRVVPSYLHMANNRLGLSIVDEGYVAHLILRMLSWTEEASQSISRK